MAGTSAIVSRRQSLSQRVWRMMLLQLVRGQRYIVLEQGDALAHALNAFLTELFGTGGDGVEHVLHIGVVEQRTVNDAASGQVIESGTAHLAAIYQHIVMTGAGSLDAQPPQHQQNHLQKAMEHRPHHLVGRHIRQHQVVLVGIDAASPTLAAIHPNVVPLAVVHVDLALHLLVAPKDDAGSHLPDEEIVPQQDMRATYSSMAR